MGFVPPGECPNCGEYVEAGASSCDNCGSCEDTGWNEDSAYDGLDIPDWEAEESRPKPENRLLSFVVTIILVAALAYVFVFR